MEPNRRVTRRLHAFIPYLLLLCIAVPAAATTWYVEPGVNTIQDGINAASDKDTV